jgi:asparagine synthase (glutamine-hydrolysing)
MCGIVGIRRFDGRRSTRRCCARWLRACTTAARTATASGSGSDVGFGHTRLSIIDLAGSPQPMTSASGPFHITFNGEIFNYQELRAELERDGVPLRTHGDTEVLLETLRCRACAASTAERAVRVRLLRRTRWHAAAGARPARHPAALLRAGAGLRRVRERSEGAAAGARRAAARRRRRRGLPHVPLGAAAEHAVRGRQEARAGHALHVGADGKLRHETWWQLPAVAEGEMLKGDAAIAAVTRARTRGRRTPRRRRAGRRLPERWPRQQPDRGADEEAAPGRRGADVRGRLRGSALRRAAVREAGQRGGRHDAPRDARDAAGLPAAVGDLSWHRDGPISEPADVAIFRIASTRGAR